MKPIKYPLELFYWNLHDEFGNTKLEVRDADRNFVFYISIKGHEWNEDKRFREELAPMAVKLLNDHNIASNGHMSPVIDPVTLLVDPLIEKNESISVNPSVHEWVGKKRGRPLGSKNK